MPPSNGGRPRKSEEGERHGRFFFFLEFGGKYRLKGSHQRKRTGDGFCLTVVKKLERILRERKKAGHRRHGTQTREMRLGPVMGSSEESAQGANRYSKTREEDSNRSPRHVEKRGRVEGPTRLERSLFYHQPASEEGPRKRRHCALASRRKVHFL